MHHVGQGVALASLHLFENLLTHLGVLCALGRGLALRRLGFLLIGSTNFGKLLHDSSIIADIGQSLDSGSQSLNRSNFFSHSINPFLVLTTVLVNQFFSFLPLEHPYYSTSCFLCQELFLEILDFFQVAFWGSSLKEHLYYTIYLRDLQVGILYKMRDQNLVIFGIDKQAKV
mgnify:CR=1 FL=1